MTARTLPPLSVQRAFGVEGTATPLVGGQDTSWSVAGLVLKPGGDEELQRWSALELGAVDRGGFRLADPVPTVRGGWLHEGWSATRLVVGAEPDRSSPTGWRLILEAGRAFHRATKTLTCPRFLRQRTDWWAVADRMTWREQPLRVGDELADCVHRLTPALAPLGPSQLVHADLSGNVLIAADQPPAIIDVAPYWRPEAYAEGVVIADAILWHGAPSSLADDVGVLPPAVARGLLFRALTDDQRARALRSPVTDLEVSHYRSALTKLGL